MRVGPSSCIVWLVLLLSLSKAVSQESRKASTPPIVTLTVWTTPNGDWHNELLKSMKTIVDRFTMLQDDEQQKQYMLGFEPNQYIHDGTHACRPDGFLDESRRERCETNCLYEGRYCQMPEGNDDPMYSHLVGSTSVVESARRQCIWQIITQEEKNPMVFFDYLETIEETDCDTQLTKQCLRDVYHQIGLAGTEIDDCIYYGTSPDEDIENALLQQQIDLALETPVTELPQVLVNGKALESEGITSEIIFQAVCEAYDEKGSVPSLCRICLDEPCYSASISVDDCLRYGACQVEMTAEASNSTASEEENVESYSDDYNTDDDYSTEEAEGEAETYYNSAGNDTDDDDDYVDDAQEEPETTSSEEEALYNSAGNDTDDDDNVDAAQEELETTSSDEDMESYSDMAGHDLDALLHASKHAQPEVITAREQEDSSSGTISEEQQEEEDIPIPQHDLSSGFAKVTHMLAKKDIFPYQMLQSCGIDFRKPGPLVRAIERGNRTAFVSGADACGADSANQFTNACDGFEKCAGFDFLEFAEKNAGALGKSFFGCLNAFATVPDTGIVLEQCTALVLNTGLWRPVGYFLEYNDMICPCISNLHSNLPSCVFQRDESTTALDGPAVKLSTCLLGQVCNRINPLCRAEVNMLNECLPDVHSEETPCEEIEAKCKEHGALLFTAPFPVAGAAFPDRCQTIARTAKGLQDAHVIQRYTSYRRRCVLKDDSVRDFGSPDEPDDGVVEEESLSSTLETEAERSFFDIWNDLPSRTRILAGGVGYLTLAFMIALLYVYKRRNRQPYKSPSRIQMRTLGNRHEPFKEEVDASDDASVPERPVDDAFESALTPSPQLADLPGLLT